MPRAYGRPYGYGRALGYGVYRGPVTFYRPYYTFHPRLSIGFGLWAGYPIAYPSYYGYYSPYYDPYLAPYPYPAYGYPYPAPAPNYPPAPPAAYPQSSYPPAPGSVSVDGPDQSTIGGVSFEITPNTAEVFVDGQRVGTAAQFTPTSQPLGLTPGRHRIEIRAAGYKTLDFDADIVAGQVIPYQGTLQR